MRRKTKLIVTICSMMLVLSAMVVGVWAASSASFNTTATITFTATNVEFDFIGGVFIGGSSTATASNKQRVTYSGSPSAWGIGDLTLNQGQSLWIGFAVKNINSDVDFDVQVKNSLGTTNNVTYVYYQKRLLGTSSTDFAGTAVTADQISSILNGFHTNSTNDPDDDAYGRDLILQTYVDRNTNIFDSADLTTANQVFYFEIRINIPDFGHSASTSFTLTINVS